MDFITTAVLRYWQTPLSVFSRRGGKQGCFIAKSIAPCDSRQVEGEPRHDQRTSGCGGEGGGVISLDTFR